MTVVETQILDLYDNSTQLNPNQITIPYTLKNRILLSPGVWNGVNFSKNQIENAFYNTKWDNKENYALIYDHEAKASNWLGNVINRRLSDDGSLVGDLELFDEDLINKLVTGKAKLGISARVLGIENDLGEFENFTFNNFSVVYDPACKNSYINLEKNKQLEKLDEIFSELKTIIKDLSGETTSQVSSGAKIDNACTGQKIKYKKKKLEDDEEEIEEDEEEMEETELNSQSLSEVTKIIERGSNIEKIEMAENEEIKQESEVLEQKSEVKDEKSEELGSKLDKILLSLDKLAEVISSMNLSKEAKEEVKEVEELSELKKEVQELKAKEKVALSEPNVLELAKPKSSLLGRQLSPAENKLKEVLLRNASQ
jgi:hypothetical protein